MVELERLGPALRFLRRRKGLRQCDVADRAGVTRAMLSAFERGARVPSLRSLAAVLNAQDLDLGLLHRAMEFVAGRPATVRPLKGRDPHRS